MEKSVRIRQISSSLASYTVSGSGSRWPTMITQAMPIIYAVRSTWALYMPVIRIDLLVA